MNATAEIVRTLPCTVCGNDVADTPLDNQDYDPAHAQTHGVHNKCGQKMYELFFITRINQLRRVLKGEKLEKFNGLSYKQQKGVIARLIHAGQMI
jgi:hypothetical protein